MVLFFIGAGNCTDIILKELQKDSDCKKYVIYLNDIDEKKVTRLINENKNIFKQIQNLSFNRLKEVNPDYIIECASVNAVKEYTMEILNFSTNLIILSSGAFADVSFLDKVLQKLKNSKAKIYIPSGAIGGIDILNSIYPYIEKVKLTTKKSLKSLDIKKDFKKPEIIFKGNVFEAIKKYPKNINVSVTLALAIKDISKVEVEIIADPDTQYNIHNIEVKSEIGYYNFLIKNFPSKRAGTSLLAPLSILGLIKKQKDNFVVGV